jgi:hypothetical protein
MKRVTRVALVVFLGMMTFARSASAASILVGEFRWDTLVNSGEDCQGATVDPSCLTSQFTLSNLWDGPGDVSLVNNTLTLPEGPFAFFDLTAPGLGLDIDQITLLGGVTPGPATVSVSFMFGTELLSLGATLTNPGTSATLTFTPPEVEPVPEPATLSLIGLGLAAAGRRMWRRPK